MSILEFMQMSIIDIFLYCIAAFFVCVSFSSIGRLFLKETGIILQALFGIGLTAAVIVIAVSFWAALAKYIIYISISISMALSILYSYRHMFGFRKVVKSLIPTFLIFSFFVIKLMAQIIPENGIIDYNCHSTYFASIPLEIFKADYFSRIRIIDAYPYEWAKYHFFNGCSTAIPLALFAKKNFVSYNIAKYLTVAIYTGAIFEQIKLKSRKSNVLCFCIGIGCAFTCTYNLTTWSLFTNNYSCILLTGLLWILFEKGNYRAACLVSIVMALSASRMVIIGGIIFLYTLWRLYEQNGKTIKGLIKRERRCAVYSLLIGIGVLTMAFSGVSVTSDFNFSKSHLFQTLFDRGWSCILPLGAFGQEETYYVGFEYLVLILYLYMVLKHLKEIRLSKLRDLSVMTKLLLTVIALTIIYIAGFSYYALVLRVYNIDQILWFMGMFWFLYVIPLFSLILNSKDKLFVLLYIVAAIIQYSVFAASVSICGYSTIFIPIIMAFAKMIMEDFDTDSKKRSVLVILAGLALVYVGIYDFKTPFFANDRDTFHIVLDLQAIPYMDVPFEYFLNEDADLAKLHALKGNRIHYNGKPSRDDGIIAMTTMSLSFVVEE